MHTAVSDEEQAVSVSGPAFAQVEQVVAPVQESIVQVAAPMPDPGEIKVNYPKPEPFKPAPEIVKIPEYKPKYPEFSESVNDWMNTVGLEAQIPRDWEYHKMPALPGNYRPYDGLGYI